MASVLETSAFLLTELKSLKLPRSSATLSIADGTSDTLAPSFTIPVPCLGNGEPLAAPGRAAHARRHRAREATRRSRRSSSSSARTGSPSRTSSSLLLTHHHLDHTGLAGTDQGAVGRARRGARRHRRAGAHGYHERHAAERQFTRELLAAHGVPERARSPRPSRSTSTSSARSADYETDVVLLDGDEIQAGGRTLRVVHRPGHSTTDTLFVDDARERGVRRRPPARGDHLRRRARPQPSSPPTSAAARCSTT